MPDPYTETNVPQSDPYELETTPPLKFDSRTQPTRMRPIPSEPQPDIENRFADWILLTAPESLRRRLLEKMTSTPEGDATNERVTREDKLDETPFKCNQCDITLNGNPRLLIDENDGTLCRNCGFHQRLLGGSSVSNSGYKLAWIPEYPQRIVVQLAYRAIKSNGGKEKNELVEINALEVKNIDGSISSGIRAFLRNRVDLARRVLGNSDPEILSGILAKADPEISIKIRAAIRTVPVTFNVVQVEAWKDHFKRADEESGR